MRNSQRVMAGVLGGFVVLLVIAAIWIKVAAPAQIELTGERVTRTYDNTDFADVSVSGQWQITIERSDSWHVTVDAPMELADSLRVEQDGGRLSLSTDRGPWLGGFDDDNHLRATISMPALASIELSGASRLTIAGFDGDRLSLTSSGASEVRGATGRFDTLALVMSGAGNVDLDDLVVTNADVEVSGAGNVKLNMGGGRLTGSVSGVGNFEYRGTVTEQSVSTSGLVSIRRRD